MRVARQLESTLVNIHIFNDWDFASRGYWTTASTERQCWISDRGRIVPEIWYQILALGWLQKSISPRIALPELNICFIQYISAFLDYCPHLEEISKSQRILTWKAWNSFEKPFVMWYKPSNDNWIKMNTKYSVLNLSIIIVVSIYYDLRSIQQSLHNTTEFLKHIH